MTKKINWLRISFVGSYYLTVIAVILLIVGYVIELNSLLWIALGFAIPIIIVLIICIILLPIMLTDDSYTKKRGRRY